MVCSACSGFCRGCISRSLEESVKVDRSCSRVSRDHPLVDPRTLDYTYAPKVCRIIAFWAMFRGFGL